MLNKFDTMMNETVSGYPKKMPIFNPCVSPKQHSKKSEVIHCRRTPNYPSPQKNDGPVAFIVKNAVKRPRSSYEMTRGKSVVVNEAIIYLNEEMVAGLMQHLKPLRPPLRGGIAPRETFEVNSDKFIVSEKAAQYVVDYILDENRFFSTEGYLDEESEASLNDIKSRLDTSKIIKEIQEKLGDSIVKMIANYSIETRMLGLDKRVIIDEKNDFATDFGNNILSSYRANPNYITPFLKELAKDVRRLTNMEMSEGVWGKVTCEKGRVMVIPNEEPSSLDKVTPRPVLQIKRI